MKLNTVLIAPVLLTAAAVACAGTPDEAYWAAPGDTNMPSAPAPARSPAATEHVAAAPAAAAPAPTAAPPAAPASHAVSATTATTITIAAAEPDTSVNIKDFAFAPTATTVSVGTTVHWKNLDGEPHTVRSVDATFASGALDQNDSYTVKFDKPGTYRYACSIHPQMVGTIVVKAAN
jgi:plastocyanin